MPLARAGFALIDGKVPFSVVPGNHDYDAMWTDAKFPPAAKFDPRDMSEPGRAASGRAENFRSVFGADQPLFKGKPWYVDAHDGGADSAQVFEAGGYRFLHIGLQFDAPDASLDVGGRGDAPLPGPADDRLDARLHEQGRRARRQPDDRRAPRGPDAQHAEMVWDKLIRRHDQVFLVLCGHQHGQAMRVDHNDAGQQVHQVLADYQDRGQTAIDAGVKAAYPVGIGDGWMRLMRFDFGGDVATMDSQHLFDALRATRGELPHLRRMVQGTRAAAAGRRGVPRHG